MAGPDIKNIGLKPDFHEETDQSKWSDLEEASSSFDWQRLAQQLANLACDPVAAPYVARGILIRLTNLSRDEQLRAVVRARTEEGRKSAERCPGVVGFTEGDWRLLEALKPTEATSADH